MKMHVKIKKKRYLGCPTFCILHALACLPHICYGKITLHTHKQMAKQSTKIRGKNYSEIFEVLLHSPILAIYPLQTVVILIKYCLFLLTFFYMFYDEHVLHL